MNANFMFSRNYLSAWAQAFVFTLAVEIPVYILVARGHVHAKKAAAAGALCSVITHPLLWFVWPRFFHDYTSYIVSGELVVACLESVIFYFVARPPRFTTAVAASFLSNAASFGLGRLVRYLGLW